MINSESNWRIVYWLGGIAALATVLVGVAESAIQAFPVSNSPLDTVQEWFAYYQAYPFMGLRNMGLLNIFLNSLAILTYLALYAVHKDSRVRSLATLATIISYLGIGVFFANNRAFPMLALSQEYASVTSEAQRVLLEAAGQTMLSVGASHTPGSFLGFALVEIAGILISVTMLQRKFFGKLTSITGILGFSVLLIVEYLTTFVSGLSNLTMVFFMLGGLLSSIWYVLIAVKLFKMVKKS
jgi:hypothetical protein